MKTSTRRPTDAKPDLQIMITIRMTPRMRKELKLIIDDYESCHFVRLTMSQAVRSLISQQAERIHARRRRNNS